MILFNLVALFVILVAAVVVGIFISKNARAILWLLALILLVVLIFLWLGRI